MFFVVPLNIFEILIKIIKIVLIKKKSQETCDKFSNLTFIYFNFAKKKPVHLFVKSYELMRRLLRIVC